VTSEGVEPAADIDVIRGGTVTFSAEAYPGFNFVGWYVKENFSAQSDLYSMSNDVEVRITSDITLYAAFIQDSGGPNNAICEWEGSGVNKTMEWKSKVYVGAKPFNPATCRIDACGYGKDGKDTVLELTVSGFSSPDSKPTSSATLTAVTSQDAKRLPRLRSERYMQIGVKADVEIDAIIVGTSMGGLAV
jgi:hypothetical protein